MNVYNSVYCREHCTVQYIIISSRAEIKSIEN